MYLTYRMYAKRFILCDLKNNYKHMKRGTDTLNKLQLETVNTGVVHLWLEGMFWKAYERSAYIFCRRVSDYKPYKKWVKAVGGEVVAIGFPTKAFDRLVDGRVVEYVDEKHCLLTGFNVDAQELKAFHEWKKNLVSSFPYAVVVSNRSPDNIVQGKKESATTDLSVPSNSGTMPVPVPDVGEKSVALHELISRLECAENIVGELRRFRMESATPLQCMIFLSGLMGKIKD